MSDDYPNSSFNQEILTRIRQIVYDSGLNIRASYITLEEGYIKIKHLTNATRIFFQRFDSNSIIAQLQAEFNVKIIVRPAIYFLKFMKLSFISQHSIEEAKFRRAIKNENGIQSHCTFEKCESTKEGFKIYFEASPMSLKLIIDNDFKLKINQKEYKVNVEKNLFPELFPAI